MCSSRNVQAITNPLGAGVLGQDFIKRSNKIKEKAANKRAAVIAKIPKQLD